MVRKVHATCRPRSLESAEMLHFSRVSQLGTFGTFVPIVVNTLFARELARAEEPVGGQYTHRRNTLLAGVESGESMGPPRFFTSIYVQRLAGRRGSVGQSFEGKVSMRQRNLVPTPKRSRCEKVFAPPDDRARARSNPCIHASKQHLYAGRPWGSDHRASGCSKNHHLATREADEMCNMAHSRRHRFLEAEAALQTIQRVWRQTPVCQLERRPPTLLNS